MVIGCLNNAGVISKVPDIQRFKLCWDKFLTLCTCILKHSHYLNKITLTISTLTISTKSQN